MFFLFPYRVDVPQEHRPVTNWLFVTAVVVVFWLQISYDSITTLYWLDGWGIRGLLGSIWLHGGLSHLFWNSVFLWVFGNAVCSKLGNLSYVPAYIGLGVAGGIGHLLFSDAPALGASGAVSGLIGMYLVLFPENTISFFFVWWFLPHRPVWFSFRSFWFILFWFALNILGAIRGGGRVAYSAHIAGFAAGVGLAILLLKTGNIKIEKYEKSILDLLGLTGGKPKSAEVRGDRTRWQHKWEVEQRANDPQEKSAIEPENAPSEFIRLKCSCGQPIKVPGKYAGRTGRCPRCSGQIEVPQA